MVEVDNVSSFVLGFLIANIFNLIELVFLGKIMRDIKLMLTQFKDEGKSDKWLK